MQSNAASPIPNSGLAAGMADSNAVNPATNDPSQQPSAVQSLLAGLNQPVQPAPQYVPPSPVQQNTSKWAGLVQGALMGLAGGLKAGMQNVNTAGTKNFQPGNGFAEGEQEDQNFQDRQQAQQQQQAQAAKEQAQQNFENSMASSKFTQEQILNRARTAESNLNAWKTAQDIDKAPQEAQDAYYQQQGQHAAMLRSEGMAQEHGEFNSLADVAAWMKQTGHTATDTVFTHERGDDGSDKITAWENPDREVNSDFVNSQLKPYGVSIPNGATMPYGGFHSMLTKASADYAASQRQQALQKQKDQAALQRVQFEQSQENSRASLAHQAATGDPTAIAEIGEGIKNGVLTEDMVPGFSKVKPQVQAYLSQKYPTLDQTSVFLDGQERRLRDLSRNALENLGVVQNIIARRPDLVGILNGRISKGSLYAGTDDKDLSALVEAIDNFGLASTGAHAIRSESARVDAKQALLNGFKNGSQGVMGAINESRGSLGYFSNLGKPKDVNGQPYGQQQSNSNAVLTATNPKTKQQIRSVDGGKTWQQVQ